MSMRFVKKNSLQYNFSRVQILFALMQMCVSRSLVSAGAGSRGLDSVRGVSHSVTFTLVLPGNSPGTGNQATYKEGEKSVKHALLPAPCSTRLDIQWKCIC